MLTVGSLFSGIGGIDLGLERAGMRVIWQAETDPYASKVLAKHWPDVPNLGDVTLIDWENDGLDYGDGIARSLHADVICGGFPCQPVSIAGKQLAEKDPGWLWPEFARAVRCLRPRWVVIENVLGLLRQGFGAVVGDLAAMGYDAEWACLPAAAFGAPHIRNRVLVVAWPMADAGSERRQERRWPTPVRTEPGPAQRPGETRRGARVFATPRLAGAWEPEPDVGRVAHGIPDRVDRLRVLGNAVVPPVAEYVGRSVLVIDGSSDAEAT